MPKCPACRKEVYFAEKVTSLGKDWHRPCLKCTKCKKTLTSGGHAEVCFYLLLCYSIPCLLLCYLVVFICLLLCYSVVVICLLLCYSFVVICLSFCLLHLLKCTWTCVCG
jgi:hypothetical protein